MTAVSHDDDQAGPVIRERGLVNRLAPQVIHAEYAGKQSRRTRTALAGALPRRRVIQLVELWLATERRQTFLSERADDARPNFSKERRRALSVRSGVRIWLVKRELQFRSAGGRS